MKNILFFCCLLISVAVQSQSNIQLSGIILGDDNKAVDLAQVSLLQQSDSTFVKSEFTDQDGTFILTNLETGQYFLQVNMIGYDEYQESISLTENTSNVSIPAIQLTANAALLDEVTVTAKLPFVERKIDRTVINPDALIANAGSDALEVLERAPGIMLDNNGEILLKGRSGVQVFINDKPSYLSGTELENYLRALPSGSIKQIEIMDNPPAKYEAAGNAGVINIIIKRNTLRGFYGNTALSYRRSRYNSSNNSLNLNYNKNKVSLYTNVYAGFYNSFQDLFINRFTRNEAGELTEIFNQNSFNERSGEYINAKIGLDYYVTDATALGLSYKNVTQPGTRKVDNTSFVSDADGNLIQRVVADNIDNSTFQSSLYNFYINHNLDTLGSNISFDADYVKYVSGNDQVFKNFGFNNQDELFYEDRINGDIPSTIEIYAAKTDYSKPLGSKSRFEAGLKTAFTKTDNEAIYTQTIDDVTKPDYNLSNRFLYDEWINAAYVNYNTSIGKLEIQAGLRAESTKLTGEQLGNVEREGSRFTRTYNSLFPTFYTSIPLDSAGVHSMNFSYGRRIDRPYFQDLNPFIRPLDRFTFYSGNPNLLPTFSHNLSLSHSYKGFLNTTLSYAQTTDGINETLEIVDGIYYSRPGNIGSSTSLTLSVSANFDVNKWYSINSYVETANLTYKSELYTEQLNSSGIYYFLSANNSFQLGKTWKASFGARYISDVVAAQLLIKSYFVANMGVQKKIFDGKGNLRLAVDDIFYTRRGNGIINNLRLTDADWNSKYDSQRLTLTFSYNFGKPTSIKQKYNSSGSDSEQQRVRG